jgi:hypothetical protein
MGPLDPLQVNELRQHVIANRYRGHMPRISSFYGITILMFFGDHHPPHFHARYGEYSARI